jgi:hypothetical protein
LLPSEFKSNWESLVKDQIMEAFDNCFSDYALLTYLVQDTINIIYNESLEIIKEKILNILKALNIIEQSINISNFTNTNNNNKNNDSESSLKLKQKETRENKQSNILKKCERSNNNEILDYETFLCKFRLIFQEHFSIIFQYNASEFQQKIKNKLNEVINKDEIYNNFPEDKKNFIKEDLNSKSFSEFSLSAMKLCLYMHLHEPKLTFNLPSCHTETNRRKLCFYYYKKDEFTNIEGFPKEKCCCAVILPCPVLRSNYSYQGIKPAVYIVSNTTPKILDECDKDSIGEKEKEKDNDKEKEKALNDSSCNNNNIKIIKIENNEIEKEKKKREVCSDNNKGFNNGSIQKNENYKKDENENNYKAEILIEKETKNYLEEENKENLKLKEGKHKIKINVNFHYHYFKFFYIQ